jgi:hypothetical protein
MARSAAGERRSPAEDQRLLVFTPAPGGSDADRMRLLVLGHDEFAEAAPGHR